MKNMRDNVTVRKKKSEVVKCLKILEVLKNLTMLLFNLEFFISYFRTNKIQETTDAKVCRLSEQFMDQRNGSNISNLNDVLILNAAVNSFLWANAGKVSKVEILFI